MASTTHLITEEHISFNGPQEKEGFWCGIVKVRELPKDLTLEEYLTWWPRLTERERGRYTATEHHNVLTLSGFNQLLTYVSSSTATTLGFSQYFAVGTTPIISVQAGDNSVQGELFRAVPSSSTITGNQLTLSTFFGAAQANGLYTNAGLYGVNATSTSGSGTLMTHTLYNYNKPNGQPISNDYIIVLS